MVRFKKIISTHTTPVSQYVHGCNKTKKRDIRHIDWEGRKQFLFIEAMIIYTKKLKEHITISEVSWLQKTKHTKISVFK